MSIPKKASVKRVLPLLMVMALMLLVLPLAGSAHAETIPWPAQTTADVNKTWTIVFSLDYTHASVTEETLFVLNNQLEKVPITYELGQRELRVTPQNAYQRGETYTLWITDVTDTDNNLMQNKVSMAFSILEAEPVPAEISTRLSDQFNHEPELTQQVAEMNQYITRLFGQVMKIQSWVFSFDGSVDQALLHIDPPEDADLTPPMDVPAVAVLNYHLLMAGEKIPEVRGAQWLAQAQATAEDWDGRLQRMVEINYMRAAYPGFGLYSETGTSDELVGISLYQDPFVTWSFTVVNPLIDLNNLSLTDGTYLVASRMEVIYPLGLFSE